MSRLLIKNIRQLVAVHDTSPAFLRGKEMGKLPVLENAWLACEDGRISAYGNMEDFPGIADWSGLEVMDAGEGAVMPCWADSHTHLVFAGWREGEFADRIAGLSYTQIAEKGGGILHSARKMAGASEQDLFEAAMRRLNEVILLGTGAIEIKSGYGLSLEAELKMLRVIARIKATAPVSVRATFLGAHAVPEGMSKEKYLDLIIREMLPAIGSEKLADYCDIFCEKGYFSADDTLKLLEAAAKHGLKGKVHAEQLSHTGGVLAGIRSGARSVDHLEFISDEDMQGLVESTTIPTLLPGAQWFLQLPAPPARQMIEAGLGLAIASDYNPGSSPSGNMHFMCSLACVQYRLSPAEAINAGTINGAHAMDLGDVTGSITPGKRANLIITDPIPSISFIPYSFASRFINRVIINGKTYETAY
ncbi:MAG: imidazolonepropionase [Bacteroidia bacterium]|nr:imidazolonepropionase [Bacteroidia bacterium]